MEPRRPRLELVLEGEGAPQKAGSWDLPATLQSYMVHLWTFFSNSLHHISFVYITRLSKYLIHSVLQIFSILDQKISILY